jgi:UDP-3-O-[3-hydroxymyristoyl] glucosamine N-acyltransferase
MRMTLGRIRDIVGGELRGDERAEVSGVASLEGAGPGDLSFLAGPRWIPAARATRASALLCAEPLPWFPGAQIVVRDPKLAMGAVLAEVEKEAFARPAGVDPSAAVHPSARLGRDVFVGARAVVEEGAEIGDGAKIHAGAVVGRRARVGAGTTVHAGAVVGEGVAVGVRCVVGPGACLGQGGFGVVRLPDGTLRSIPQVGSVVVEDGVEIGALCTVDRGTLGPTVVGAGTRMDAHCHVAHNVRIGRHCLLVAYARIAGSTVLEDGVTVAEDVGITDNVAIGKGARIGGGSRVYADVPAGAEVWGAPARPLALEKRIQAILPRLPDLREKVRVLWKKSAGSNCTTQTPSTRKREG